jgi:hypothetical protein
VEREAALMTRLGDTSKNRKPKRKSGYLSFTARPTQDLHQMSTYSLQPDQPMRALAWESFAHHILRPVNGICSSRLTPRAMRRNEISRKRKRRLVDVLVSAVMVYTIGDALNFLTD